MGCLFNRICRLGARVLILALLAGPVAQAQAPNWQQAVASRGGSARAVATATGPNGEVYLAGNFSGTVAFGNLTLTSDSSSQDVFVAKWNPVSQQFMWAQRAGGAEPEELQAMAVQGSRLYLLGTFNSRQASFGNATLTNAEAVDKADTYCNNDVFLAQLTDLGSSGRFGWAQQAGGKEYDVAIGLAVSGPNVYVAGTFPNSTFRADPGALSSPARYSFDDKAFLLKFADRDSTAELGWARQIGGDSFSVTAVAAQDSSIYVAGSFRSDAKTPFSFGPAHFDPARLDVSGGFVAKFTDEGTSTRVAWLQSMQGSARQGNVEINALAVSGPNVYVAGDFDGDTLYLGNSHTATLAGGWAGYWDVFVVKLTDTGDSATFAWVQRAGGSRDDNCLALAAQGRNVYVVGYFISRRLRFGRPELVLRGHLLTYTHRIFVAQLADTEPTGSFSWTERAGIAGWRRSKVLRVHRCFGFRSEKTYRTRFPRSATGVALAVSGSSVYVAGDADCVVRFGRQRLATPKSKYSSMAFLARLSAQSNEATPVTRPEPDSTASPPPSRPNSRQH